MGSGRSCNPGYRLTATHSTMVMALRPRTAKTQPHQGRMGVGASTTGVGEGVGGAEISCSAMVRAADMVGDAVSVAGEAGNHEMANPVVMAYTTVTRLMASITSWGASR